MIDHAWGPCRLRGSGTLSSRIVLVWRERSRKARAQFLCAGIHVNVYEYAGRRWGVYLKYSSTRPSSLMGATSNIN